MLSLSCVYCRVVVVVCIMYGIVLSLSQECLYEGILSCCRCRENGAYLIEICEKNDSVEEKRIAVCHVRGWTKECR